METALKTDQSADQTFYNLLSTAVAGRQFVRLEYLTNLSEFIKADVSLKGLLMENGIEFLELATGDTVPLDRIVSISGHLSPNFPGYASYSCDC